ncbi:MAG: endonuclease VIII [Cyanobacteria bacterium J06621_8]
MPEGPEIRIAADKIAKAIANKPITSIFFAFEDLKPYEEILVKQLITRVETKGKGMLIRFDNGLSIYSHNQLYGKWMIRKAHNYPETKRQLRLAIHNERKSALLYSASDIDVLDENAIAVHPFLSNLGLDVLDPQTTPQAVAARLLEKPWHRRRFTSLLLDQRFLAGLGNYLRSEILFVARLHPTLRPLDCSPEQISILAQAAIDISRQSYQTKGITNDLKIVTELEADGYKRRDYRHWVFDREERPCYICQTSIIKEISGGRRYYFCPECQGSSNL